MAASKKTATVDGLSNAITGAGGKNDPRTGNRFSFRSLTQQEIEAAYRGSGLMRKIINIPADDCVREWREWRGDAQLIAKLWDEEKRLGIQQKVRLAEIMRGLGGGAFILGLPGNPAEPAVPGKQGSLAFIHVVNRYQLTGEQWINDPLDPLYGGPRYWLVTGDRARTKIHASRVIPFIGEPLPLMYAASDAHDAFWGESRVQSVLDAVQDSDSARGSFANLIAKARLTRIGIPGLSQIVSTKDGENAISKRLENITRAESLFNASVYDTGSDGGPAESIDDISYNFAGIKDVMDAYGMWVSAISDIPSTRLLGIAPTGLSGAGQGQQKDWNKQIRARQTLFMAPCLDKLDKYLVPSATGGEAKDLWYEFPPLDLPDEKTLAETFKLNMEAIEKLQNTQAIPDEAFNKAVQSFMTENGVLPALEDALAELPDEERFGLSPSVDPAFNADAAPRTLYVRRKVINTKEVLDWAKSQGFEKTLPASELDVTVAFSRKPVDWLAVGQDWAGNDDGKMTVPAGGARLVEPLGDKGAIVLLFNSSALSYRHEDIKRSGASWDYDQYQPHITITYEGPMPDNVEPYRGKIVLGPEIFEEVLEDWEKGRG